MSHTNNLFNICHVMFSSGITKPEVAKTIDELRDIIKPDESLNLDETFKTLVEQGYVGKYDKKYFLLGKGIVAVAAIFT